MSSPPYYVLLLGLGTSGDYQVIEPFPLPRLWLGSTRIINFIIAGGGVRIYPYPSSAHRHRNRLIPTIGSIVPPRPLFFGTVLSYVGTNNDPRLSVSSPTNGVRWIIAGPFALVHGTGRILVLWFCGLPMCCHQMVATTRACTQTRCLDARMG